MELKTSRDFAPAVAVPGMVRHNGFYCRCSDEFYDLCSGPGIQDLESNYIETALAEDFEFYVSLPTWGRPQAGIGWRAGVSTRLSSGLSGSFDWPDRYV
jgi:hypothetical protein